MAIVSKKDLRIRFISIQNIKQTNIMENILKEAEKEISSMIKQLIEEKEKSIGTEKNESVSDDPAGDSTTSPTGEVVKYPNVDDKFIQSLCYDSCTNNSCKLFITFGLLVILSVIVLYKCFDYLRDKQFQNEYLLFLFGVIALLFTGLVVLAFFMIKDSERYRIEKNEGENKRLAFRQKMLESLFELENRNIITDKQRKEKELALNEKVKLYAMDEQHRAAEHKRRMQLRKYEIVENYMKHVVDLAKTKEETNKRDNDSTEK